MEAVCCLAQYFGVTTDYLIGISGIRSPYMALGDEELLLIIAYRNSGVHGRMRIIQVCMNECDKAEGKGEATSAVPTAPQPPSADAPFSAADPREHKKSV